MSKDITYYISVGFFLHCYSLSFHLAVLALHTFKMSGSTRPVTWCHTLLHLESSTHLLFLQAWCKFYENARSFILVPPTVVNTQCLNSVHLCEAPGAFITSLNHFLKLHNPGIEVCIQTHQNTPPKCCRVCLEQLLGKEITSFTVLRAMAVADCAISYAVSHQPVTVQAQVEFQVSRHGVCSGYGNTQADFL